MNKLYLTLCAAAVVALAGCSGKGSRQSVARNFEPSDSSADRASSERAESSTEGRSFEVASLGGISSNGGGGDTVDTLASWHTIGGGQESAQWREISMADQLRELARNIPAATFQVCSGDVGQFLEIPAAWRASFSLELQETGASSVPLTLDRVCANPLFYEAYSRLAMAIQRIRSGDVVGSYLIDRLVANGGPIPIVVNSDRATLAANGSTVEEFSWFDHATGKIGWAPRREGQGLMFLMLRRPEQNFLRHELAHLLLKRTMGAAYPNDTIWHDTRFSTSDMEYQQAYLGQHTSVAAAFIEGFAGAMEGNSFFHPYIVRQGFPHLYREQDGRYSYSDLSAFRTGPNQAYQAPLASETYLGSTLARLFEGWRPIPARDVPLLNQSLAQVLTSAVSSSQTLFTSVNPQRMQAAIDAVIAFHPTSAVTFANALDRQTRTDVGSRWYREFYFHELDGAPITGLESGSFSRSYVPAGDESRYLSPLLDAEQTAAREASWTALGGGVTSEAMAADIADIMGFVDLEWSRISQRHGRTFEQAAALQRTQCAVARRVDAFANSGDTFIERVAATLRERYQMNFYLNSLENYVEGTCDVNHASVAQTAERLRAAREAVETLRAMQTVPGTAAHGERLKRWVAESRPRIADAWRDLLAEMETQEALIAASAQ